MRTLATKPGRRPRIGILATSVVVVFAALSPTVAASAEPAPAPSPTSTHHPLAMGSFSASSYAAKAARLPAGLLTALHRDLGITGAEYLADADASARAVDVVASLKSAGVHVLGSKIHGTKLTVNIASSSDTSTVTKTGATAVVGSPVTEDVSKRDFHSATTNDTYGGQGYFFFQNPGQTSGTGVRCSIGFNGYSVANGTPQFSTAGHCATVMNGQTARLITQKKPSDNGGTLLVTSQALGTAVSGEAQFGSGRDYGIVGEGAAGLSPQPSVYTWGAGGIGGPLDTAPTGIADATAAINGGNLCKSGATSGYTCGMILAVDASVPVSSHIVNSIVASTCVLPGDSGGAAIDGQHALGISSGSDFPDVTNPTPSTCNNGPTCATLSDGTTKDFCQSVFFPMIASTSGNTNSVMGQQGTHWQLAVQVTSTATVTSPASGATVNPSATMTGTVTGASPGSTALLYLDGATIPYAKADASSGTWSIPLSGLSQGSHSYSVAAGIGWSPGALVSGTFVESAVSTATVAFPSSSDQAYPFSTMTGTISWPVASSKAALYLGSSTTPFATVDASSGSWKIPLVGVAVGSHAYTVKAFSGNALTTAATTGTFTLSQASRIGGVDRYDTAVRIAQAMFPTGSPQIPVPVLYVANGLNYPDGLSAAAAAAEGGGAMLLTDPSALPSDVLTEINTLQPQKIVVAGGTASVSDAVYNQLAMIVGADNIVRRGGATRYETSAALAAPFTGHIDTVFIANGGNFPDALSESAAAAKSGSPVILVPGDASSLDASTLALLNTFTPNTIVVAGGTGSISAGIANQLAGLFPTVERLGGVDRYQTAKVINAAFFPAAANAYVATGDTFPDALAGGVIAAWAHAPLVVTNSSCMESYDLQALNGWGTTSATLLGGTGSLSNAVQSMVSCG